MATSVTTNYSGRQKDLFISQGVNPTKVGLQKVHYSFGKISSYIAGVQKLAQRYMVALFNTGLVNQLQRIKSNNLQEATHTFNFANWDVLQEFKAYQNDHPSMPEDEQLAAAQLTDLSVTAGKLHMTIQLITKAGSNIPVLLPIPLV